MELAAAEDGSEAMLDRPACHGGVQRLPLLRGLLRRVPGHGAPAGVSPSGDLNYLANLCHSCRGCYYACQYAPPHEFGINVPQASSPRSANESYAEYAWPGPLAAAFTAAAMAS